MHQSAKGVDRQDRVMQSKAKGIIGEERKIAYESKVKPPKAEKGSVYDFSRYVPIGSAAKKLKLWQKQGAEINYITSRRYKEEIDIITKILKKYDFPNNSNLHFRQKNEDYRNVAEKIKPDILIEDDCESIGGKKEMTYTYINSKLKEHPKSIPVKEFGGIDHLPDSLEDLTSY